MMGVVCKLLSLINAVQQDCYFPKNCYNSKQDYDKLITV